MGYLVVIPYLSSGAQGRELVYAVEGWRQHFDEDQYIVIVGDYDSNVEEVFECVKGWSVSDPTLEYIPCPQIPDTGSANYRPHLDHVHKFRKVLEQFPETEGFIYACDDMYAVNDFDINDVKFIKIKEDDIKGNAQSKNGWQRDAARTRALLIEEGLPIKNYVCHLPVYYEVEKLTAIWDRYDCDHISYIVEDIYFNKYFSSRIPLRLDVDTDNLKFGVYEKNPDLDKLRAAFQKKIWLTNSPVGWIPELDNLLKQHYKL